MLNQRLHYEPHEEKMKCQLESLQLRVLFRIPMNPASIKQKMSSVTIAMNKLVFQNFVRTA